MTFKELKSVLAYPNIYEIRIRKENVINKCIFTTEDQSIIWSERFNNLEVVAINPVVKANWELSEGVNVVAKVIVLLLMRGDKQ